MTLNQFEKRTTSKKWATIEQAKQGLSGSPKEVERLASARMKAQEIFEKIRRGQA